MAVEERRSQAEEHDRTIEPLVNALSGPPGPEPARPHEPARWLLAAALAMAGMVVLWRVATPDAPQPVLLLLVVPVALTAVGAGVRGGLAAALVATAIFVSWVAFSPDMHDYSAAETVARALTYLVVGMAVGHLADRVGRATRAARAATSREAAHERALRELVELAREGVWILDREWRTVYVSPSIGEIVGSDPAEMVGRHVTEAWHEETRPEVERHLERRARGIAERYDMRVRRRDGTEAWLHLTARPLFENGQVSGALAFVADITDRVEAEHEQRQAAERFAGAFENAPIGMALLRLNSRTGGTFLRVNPAVCRLLGRDEDDLLGREFRTLQEPADVEAEMSLLRRLLSGSIERYRLEKRFLRPDGSVVWAALSMSLLPPTPGEQPHGIAQLEDVSERRRFEASLKEAADRDALTGLVNRRRFEEELALRLAQARSFGGGGVLIALDIDRFKYVNDTAGGRVGDRLLERVAKVLSDSSGSEAVVGRLGSDEFAVLLEGITLEAGRELAGILVRRVHDDAAARAGQARLRVTASAAVATYTGEEEADEFLAVVDVALGEAKDAGGGRVVAYDPTSARKARMASRMAWAERLRTAFEQDELLFHAQPIVDLERRVPVGYELLLRLAEPGHRIVLPDRFLDAAEHFGLMPAIDRWAVREAALIAAALQDSGTALTVEVNLSPVSVSDDWIVGFIEDQLERNGVDPARMVFEITERAAIANLPQAQALVERLRALGCRFALDDFGSGFGSFYNLKHLAFDYLKIDGEFVRRLADSPADRHIVRAVAEAATGLGKIAIAEYVSDERSVELLRGWGIPLGQGNFLGRPVPAWEAVAAAGERVR